MMNSDRTLEYRRVMLPFLALLVAMVMALPANSYATQVDNVSLTPSANGDVVTIHSDAPLAYKVFDLDAPARVVLIVPGASLKPGMEPLRNKHSGVKSVFPTASKDGVRIEIGLDQHLKYNIAQQGKKLTLHFAAPPKQAAGKSAGAVLEDLSVRDHGDVTELVLRGQHMDANHDAFVTNHGRTMILDLWGATSKLTKEHYAVSTQKVSSVTVGEAKGRVRLVVGLLPGEQETHQIDASNNEMVVRFGNVTPKPAQGAIKVEDVHFKPDNQVAHVVIRTDAANPVVNIHQQGSNVIMDIKKAVLAAGQQRSQDVSEFPGPVKQVDAYKVDDHVRIVARLRNKVEVSSYQQGNVLTVNFEPKALAAAEKAAGEEGQTPYTGQKVSFDFKDIDIRNALKLIAEMSNLNIIMSDDVSGKLTMRLVNVPWDQALDLILSARGLGKEQQGNVMRIAPIKVLADERQSRLAAMKGSQQLEPLITVAIPLNYASVKDIKKMLSGSSSSSSSNSTSTTQSSTGQSASPSSSQTSGFNLLSPRGTFMADERTNTLIVKDTQESVNNIKRLITQLDKPVKQVLIAARIIEATDDFTRDLGVRWGGNFISHSPQISGGAAQGATTNTGGTVSTTGSQGYLVDLPAAKAGTAGTGGAIGFNFGYLNGLVNLNLELSAAETDGKIKIVSNPRVITTNLKKATITQGYDVPYQSTSANSGTNTQFKKADLGLEVTPQISSDNRIMMHVKATKNAPISTSTQNPIMTTKEIDTNILMDNGETVVIGGIYTRDKEHANNAVPGLSKIPLLGWLFKNDSKIDKKTELLIFLTPTILKPGPAPNSDVAQAQ